METSRRGQFLRHFAQNGIVPAFGQTHSDQAAAVMLDQKSAPKTDFVLADSTPGAGFVSVSIGQRQHTVDQFAQFSVALILVGITPQPE